jgi:creatinine amidohydrolase/Fe(II)-dependent formamide hydrolase-like protein
VYVPEGNIDLPPGGLRYPGTIGVTPETFKRLLTDIATSLRANGFENIILIGDSGGNQQPQAEVATALSAAWTDGKTRIFHIPEYYNWVERQQWLRARGINEVLQPVGLHDEFSATAIMMLTDPTTVRMQQRIRAGHFSINGVDLAPIERTLALARELVDWIADVTVAAIHERLPQTAPGSSAGGS